MHAEKLRHLARNAMIAHMLLLWAVSVRLIIC